MKVVILPGGQWQEAIVKYFIDKGHQVFIVNPFKTEVTGLGEHLFYDVKDVEGIIKHLNKIKPDIITTDQSDIAVMPTAMLCEFFSLYGNSVEAAYNFTDKYQMHLHAKKLGILNPDSTVLSLRSFQFVDEIKEFINKVGYPVVLKPVDANASCGYVYLEREPTPSDIGYCLSFSRQIMLQEYIKGTQLTVDGILSGGKHVSLTLAERRYFREGVISEARYPANVSDDIKKSIFMMNDLYIETSGAKFGITHAEYILNDDGVYLLEIGLRGGGNATSSVVVPWMSGINLYDVLYDNLTGVSYPQEAQYLNRTALIKFFEFGKGKVKNISGIDDVLNHPQVEVFKMWVKEGDVIREARNGKERHGVAVICSENEADLERTLEYIEYSLKLELE